MQNGRKLPKQENILQILRQQHQYQQQSGDVSRSGRSVSSIIIIISITIGTNGGSGRNNNGKDSQRRVGKETEATGAALELFKRFGQLK